MPMSDGVTGSPGPVGLGEPYGRVIRGEPIRNEPRPSVVATCIWGGGSTGVLWVIWDNLVKESQEPVGSATGSIRCTWVHRTDPCVTLACTLRAWKHPYDHSCVARAGTVGVVRVQHRANRNQLICGPVQAPVRPPQGPRTTVYVPSMGETSYGARV